MMGLVVGLVIMSMVALFAFDELGLAMLLVGFAFACLVWRMVTGRKE